MNYSFYPKRPVKSFQDLEVYQKLLAIAVAVAKRINPVVIVSTYSVNEAKQSPRNDLPGKLVEIVVDLPIRLAEAHSLRFSDSKQAIQILEEIMVGCNKTVVYLELYRDLYNDNKIEIEFFEEQIKNILSTRFKILHLQRSWIKFTPLEVKNK